MRNLDSFITAIRQDGVKVGKEAAAQIRRDAEASAATLIGEAEAKAKRIIAEAESERERIRTRTQADLSLAARDTMIKLRQALNDALSRVLLREVRDELEDPTFLAGLIRDVVQQYARSDAAGSNGVSINMSESMRQQLKKRGIEALVDNKSEDRICLELRDTLTESGFEYRADEGTVEITPEGVVSVLTDLLGPELQQLVAAQLATSANGEQENESDVIHATVPR